MFSGGRENVHWKKWVKLVDKSHDEHVKVKLASLFISDVIAKEFKYHRTCCQSLTQAATASLS